MDTEDIFSFDSIRKDEQASSSGRAGDAASAVAGQGAPRASRAPRTARYVVTDPEQLSPAMKQYFEDVVKESQKNLATQLKNLQGKIQAVEERIGVLKKGALNGEEKEQLGKLSGTVSTLNSNIETIQNHLSIKIHGAINSLTDGLVDIDTKVSTPASKKRRVESPQEKLVRQAAQHVLHRYAEYLVNNNGRGWPEWPTGGMDQWPRFPPTVDGARGRPCLRFDKSNDFDHANNQRMAKYLLDAIDEDRGRWAGAPKAQQAQLAKDVPREVFAQYLRTWFGNLSKAWRSERERAAAATPTSADTHGASTSSDVASPKQRPLKYDQRDPNRVFYGRRRTTSEYVSERRKTMPQFADPIYEILDTKNAQMNIIFENDFAIPGSRRWVRPAWMSRRCFEILEQIVSHRLAPDAPDGGGVDYLANVPVSKDPEEVDQKPTWVKETFFSRLQRWMFDPEWISQYGAANTTNIVPVDEPTSFEAVKQLDWYRKAAGINYGSVPAAVVARLSDRDLVLQNDDLNAENHDGFDTERRAVGRQRRSVTASSSRSRAESVTPY